MTSTATFTGLLLAIAATSFSVFVSSAIPLGHPFAFHSYCHSPSEFFPANVRKPVTIVESVVTELPIIIEVLNGNSFGGNTPSIWYSLSPRFSHCLTQYSFI